MKTPRNLTIDLLRGIAMIAMILIHTTYYFIGHDKLALFLWNWSQFAVPIFIFCSGYVFFLKPNRVAEEGILKYMWKRARRLVLPYYIFLIFFFLIIWLTTGKVTINYVWQSLILIGGADISWLVLLMLELSLVFPLLILLKQKHEKFFIGYIILAAMFSVVTIFLPLPISYKPIMWISWSIMGALSLFYIQKLQIVKIKKPLLLLLVVSLFLFLISYLFESLIHHDLSFYGNKYPPTLLILSFGSAMIVFLYWLAEKQIFKPLQKLLIFTSTYSYSIFFIHYCFLIALASFLPTLHTTWYVFFLSVLGGALLVQYLWNRRKLLIA